MEFEKDNIPDLVFIVPYRNRKPEKTVFEIIMEKNLKGLNYKIFFIHQNDKRLFNRGAIKNIGFLYIKKTWPKDYKNIIIIFNDIDAISYYKGQFNYKTKKNIIKHHFGFKQTLGGIFSILASDFEKINGFPNIWTWGLEDNIIQKRAKNNNIEIDYSNFIDIKNRNKIIFLNNYEKRKINKKIYFKFEIDGIYDGIKLIKNLKYGKTHKISKYIYMIDVDHFDTAEDPKIYEKDLFEINPIKQFEKNKKYIKNKENVYDFIFKNKN